MDSWKKAISPNYEINKDKLYPYSEMPFQNEYKLVKIPLCRKNLIEHVHYFGYGKIVTPEGIMGFSNCYNVNYEFNLVGDGPDEGRKIPNRIPISDKFECCTRNYIKDNSVRTVTVTNYDDEYDDNFDEHYLTDYICQDIVRIVNSELGKVIVYGFRKTEIEKVTDELRRTACLFYCPIYKLPCDLELTYFKTYRVYLGINELKKLLYGNVKSGDFNAAVTLTGCLTDTYCGDALAKVVHKLLANNIANIIVYAGELWNKNNKEIVREHFPPVFQHIFDGDYMHIINYKNNQALVLEFKTMLAWGDGHYKSSNKSGWRWKIIPIWDTNKVSFKLYNIDSDTYLQLSPTVEEDGVGQATGSKDPEELGDKFYFKPITRNGQITFHIFNDEDKPLELPAYLTPENEAVVEYKSVDNDKDERLSWILITSPQDKEKSYKKDRQSISEDEDEE